MKFRKKSWIALSLAVLVILGAVTAISVKNIPNNSPQTAAEKTETNDVQQVSITGDLQEHFTSLNQLKQRAAAIVEVDIVDSEVVVYDDMPFTISTAKVLSTVKGEVKEGQEIKLIETGGKYKLTGENPKQAKGQEVDVTFEGIPVMQPGDHLFLFVDKFVGPQITDAYIPLGVYQGKFKIEADGKLYQQAPAENQLKDYKQPLNNEIFKENLK